MANGGSGGGVPRWALVAAGLALVFVVLLSVFGTGTTRHDPATMGEGQRVDNLGPTAAPEADPMEEPVGDGTPDAGAVSPDVPGQQAAPGAQETEPVASGPRAEDPYEPIEAGPEQGAGLPAEGAAPPQN